MHPYHHGNLRAALTETAIELGRESGPDGVVLREVARRTGVSHNAAYRHFADRGDLLAVVAAEALSRLAGAMTARARQAADPDPAVRSMLSLGEVGRVYVEFAIEEPGLFAVASSTIPHAVPPEADPLHVLSETLDECVRAGAIPMERRPHAEIYCWSAVHGFAMLHLSGPLSSVAKQDREAALNTLLERIGDSLTRPVG